MQIEVATFRGEAPKMAPRLLPNEMSQYSGGSRLLSGDIGVWRGFLAATAQAIATPTAGIYFLDDQLWLSWSTGQLGSGAIEIDVAKADIGGDTSFRTYFCGTDAPRFTDLGLASGLTSAGNPVTWSPTVAANPGPYPINSRKLGVPNPVTPITLAQANLITAPGYTLATTITENMVNPQNWTLSNSPGLSGAQFVSSGGNPNGPSLFLASISNSFGYAVKSFALDATQPVTYDIDFEWATGSNGFESQGYMHFLLGCDAAGNGLALELFVATTYLAFNFRALNGNALGALLFSAVVPQASISTWQGSGAWAGPFAPGVYYHATATVTPGSGANANVAVVAVNIFNHKGGTSIFTGGYSTGQTYALCPCLGASYGVGTVMTGGMGQPYWTQLYFDNLILTGQAPAPSSSSLEATTYLYTLVNDLGEESGPCPAMISFDGSGTITRQIGEAVAVPLPASLAATGVDTSYFMVGAYLPPLQIGLGGAALVPNIPSPSMNLYRAVTGSTGTALLLVAANVPFGTVVQVGTSGATPPAGMTTGVIDALADSALSEAMISQLWSPPPASMLGILPLPNGIYAGFTGNTLCLSAQGVPHAWPIEYELDFDFPIVGIGNIDSTVVVCTENFPYLCSGATPDAYSQTKASYPYACASKRSIQFIQNVGVVFATFEGLVSIAGPGMERVMTRDLFSKLEWGNLNPATMLSAVNDNRYFCWYDATGIGGAKAGFYLDLQPQSPYPGIPSIVSGKCSLAFHATVRYNDPLSDGLYMILDSSPAP